METKQATNVQDESPALREEQLFGTSDIKDMYQLVTAGIDVGEDFLLLLRSCQKVSLRTPILCH